MAAMHRLRRFLTGRIGRKVMATVGVIVALGLVVLVVFYADRQQSSILAQQERTLTKVTESVIKGLRTVMLAGYADIGHALFERLRAEEAGAMDIRILRPDGIEAFHDNATIRAVNRRLGEERFRPRDDVARPEILPAGDESLRHVIEQGRSVSYRDGLDVFTLLAPITSEPSCGKCHGAETVRAILKVSTSLAPVRSDIRRTWIQASVILAVALAGILFSINVLIRRTVVTPISRVTHAMRRAADGDLTQQVPVLSRDELGQMATSFNQMIGTLLQMYSGLEQERDKLSTILLGAGEGIVVTNGEGRVVLVNPAAERLLGKSAEQIGREGFEALLDDREAMRERLRATGTTAETVSYRDRVLSLMVASIDGEDERRIGTAALLRDVTDETRLREELQRLSDTDGLTGLYNRRFFDAKLEDELSLARRYGRPLSLFVFDVDHFKRFNDTYGHDQGDRVLQAMGKAMRECAATTDVVCRYGGEEFVCILPGTGLEDAVAAAERLRRHVEDMRVDDLAVTISIGVATYPDIDVRDPDGMVKIADEAMYAAKEAGRNRVRTATRAATAETA
jgi:diguanylate cyclase (GGDEF)-like protein/PAS domain S-box-containing protein